MNESEHRCDNCGHKISFENSSVSSSCYSSGYGSVSCQNDTSINKETINMPNYYYYSNDNRSTLSSDYDYEQSDNRSIYSENSIDSYFRNKISNLYKNGAKCQNNGVFLDEVKPSPELTKADLADMAGNILCLIKEMKGNTLKTEQKSTIVPDKIRNPDNHVYEEIKESFISFGKSTFLIGNKEET